MESKIEHAMPTVVAMLLALVVAWALLLVFFVKQDTYRKEQIKGIRKDVKSINTQLATAAEIRDEAMTDIGVIREDVAEIHETIEAGK